MKKVSEFDCDSTVKNLMDSELGFLLLEADEKNVYDLLLEKELTWEKRIGMFGDGCHITYHLFLLLYNSEEKDINLKPWLVQSRANAVHNIFKRWTDAGYNKRHAKSPYGCKAFQKYLDEIEFMKADYMLLMVD